MNSSQDNSSLSPSQTKINPETIIKSLQIIEDTQSFSKYLNDVWLDLTQRSQNKKGISKLTLLSYYDLPGIIGERLYAVFETKDTNYVDLPSFTTGMTTLFLGTFEETSKFIFDFYDFDKDGYVTAEDIRTILSYITLSDECKSQEPFQKRVNSQTELRLILKKCFAKGEPLNFIEFKYVIEQINSDIYFIILLFLLSKRPFTKETLINYKAVASPIKNKEPEPNMKFVVSPSTTSTFSPYDMFKRTITKKRKATLTHEQSKLNKELNDGSSPVHKRNKKQHNTGKCKNEEDIHKAIQGNKHTPITRMNPIKKSFNENEMKILPAINQNLLSKHSSGSKETFFDDEDDETNSNTQQLPLDLSSDEDETDPEDGDDIITPFTLKEQPAITQEGILYKFVENKMRPLFFKLIHKDLYFYKSQKETLHKGMHHLSGLFLRKEKVFFFENKQYFSLSLISPSKTRTYYLTDQNEFEQWYSKFQIATGYTNLTEVYDIKQSLGSGKFGEVKLGIHKQTQQKVAIKIVSKKEMTNVDMELMRTEIEILKICQHPNIITLYDVFENEDYFYIIMEYCDGGDLFSYLEERKFVLPEQQACEIIHKICTAVYYIHSFGIAHRDIKPENILMTSTGDVRIVDFGLSKMIGPEEQCKEPYGTLTYVAPEIVRDEPYTKQVDLWSIGVMTFLMLGGYLPFNDVSDNLIAEKIVNLKVYFLGNRWAHISKEAKQFIQGLLDKDPKQRMTIYECLEHKWLAKFYGNFITKYRKISRVTEDNEFEVYSSMLC